MDSQASELESYRRGVIEEFEARREEILARLQALDPRVRGVQLAGSVLEARRFDAVSDIDLAVDLEAGMDQEEQEEVIARLRGQVVLGGGMADVVPVSAGRGLAD